MRIVLILAFCMILSVWEVVFVECMFGLYPHWHLAIKNWKFTFGFAFFTYAVKNLDSLYERWKFYGCHCILPGPLLVAEVEIIWVEFNFGRWKDYVEWYWNSLNDRVTWHTHKEQFWGELMWIISICLANDPPVKMLFLGQFKWTLNGWFYAYLVFGYNINWLHWDV